MLCLACKSLAGLPVQPTACTSLDQPGSASWPPETLQRRPSLGLVQEDQSRKRLPLPRCSCDRQVAEQPKRSSRRTPAMQPLPQPDAKAFASKVEALEEEFQCSAHNAPPSPRSTPTDQASSAAPATQVCACIGGYEPEESSVCVAPGRPLCGGYVAAPAAQAGAH